MADIGRVTIGNSDGDLVITGVLGCLSLADCAAVGSGGLGGAVIEIVGHHRYAAPRGTVGGRAGVARLDKAIVGQLEGGGQAGDSHRILVADSDRYIDIRLGRVIGGNCVARLKDLIAEGTHGRTGSIPGPAIRQRHRGQRLILQAGQAGGSGGVDLVDGDLGGSRVRGQRVVGCGTASQGHGDIDILVDTGVGVVHLAGHGVISVFGQRSTGKGHVADAHGLVILDIATADGGGAGDGEGLGRDLTGNGDGVCIVLDLVVILSGAVQRNADIHAALSAHIGAGIGNGRNLDRHLVGGQDAGDVQSAGCGAHVRGAVIGLAHLVAAGGDGDLLLRHAGVHGRAARVGAAFVGRGDVLAGRTGLDGLKRDRIGVGISTYRTEMSLVVIPSPLFVRVGRVTGLRCRQGERIAVGDGTRRHTGDADGNGGLVHGHRNRNSTSTLVVGILGRVGGHEGLLAHIANALRLIFPSPAIAQLYIGEGVAVDSRHIAGDVGRQIGLINGILHAGGLGISTLAQRDAGLIGSCVSGSCFALRKCNELVYAIFHLVGDVRRGNTGGKLVVQLRLLGFFVIVEVGGVGGADGHAAAISSAPSGCQRAVFALGSDGRAACRVRPAMLVRAEGEGFAILCNHITLIRRIRGEDGAILQVRVGRAGGERNLGVRRGLFPRGDADAGIICQTRVDGDGLTIMQIEVVGAAVSPLSIHAAFRVQRAVFPVVRDLHTAGNGHVGILVHIHAAAVVLGRVAGDGAAVHDECAGRIIGAVHIHAAAIAVRTHGLIAGDRAAVHGKGAVFEAHTAAVVLGRVAGDGGIAAHGEAAFVVEVVHIHTAAAAASGRVAGDRAAAHGERAAAIQIHTAAVAAAVFAIISAVSGNSAVRHFECAVVHVHTAALAVRRVAVARAAADGAVFHGKCAVGDIHTAAAAIRRVAGDAAAVHIEGAAIHIHAAAIHARSVCDFAGCTRVAVGQGKGEFFENLDGIKAAIRRDALAVEAQHHAIQRHPCSIV